MSFVTINDQVSFYSLNLIKLKNIKQVETTSNIWIANVMDIKLLIKNENDVFFSELTT